MIGRSDLIPRNSPGKTGEEIHPPSQLQSEDQSDLYLPLEHLLLRHSLNPNRIHAIKLQRSPNLARSGRYMAQVLFRTSWLMVKVHDPPLRQCSIPVNLIRILGLVRRLSEGPSEVDPTARSARNWQKSESGASKAIWMRLGRALTQFITYVQCICSINLRIRPTSGSGDIITHSHQIHSDHVKFASS